MKTVSCPLVSSIWDKIKADIPEQEIIKSTGVQHKELQNKNDRIDQHRYKKLMGLIDYYDFPVNLPPQGMIEEMYRDFPDITNVFLNAPSLSHALNFFQHYRMCIGELDTITTKSDQNDLTLCYHSEFSASATVRAAIFNFNIIDSIIHYYYPGEDSGCEITLSHHISDQSLENISNVFHCRVRIGKENTYKIPNNILYIPAQRYNPALQPYMLDRANLCLNAIQNQQFYSTQVKRLILQYLSFPTDRHQYTLQQWVCRQLNLSRWTLNRRLQQEQTSLTYLYTELRCHEACKLLKNNSEALIDISQRLGFVNQSAFQRFFREKMNCTPLKYRKLYTQMT